MELRITFRQGMIRGEGRDWVGTFVLSGHYDLADGKCRWTKRYLGKHDVYYQWFNEGKGIWGTWQITSHCQPRHWPWRFPYLAGRDAGPDPAGNRARG